MPRFGRSFPMPRRGVRRAAPIAATVTMTGHANVATSGKSAVLIVRVSITGHANVTVAGHSAVLTFTVISPPVNPFDGVPGQRTEELRFEILDQYGALTGVLHPTKTGTITFNPSNRVARILSGMTLDPIEAAKLTPGVSRIRPVWTLANYTTEYPLGVFLYQGGSEDELAGGTWITCAPLPDRGEQLAQKISDMIAVASGTACTDAVRTVAAGGGIPVTDMNILGSATLVGSTPLTFALGQATRFDILNVLTNLIGYLPVYFDNSGILVARPVPVPNDAAPDRRYIAGQKTTVHADSVSTVRALPKRPNVYIVRSTSPTSSAIAGRYDVPASAANSLANIGYEIVDVTDVAGLTDSSQAQAIAAARAKRDEATVRTVVFSAMADPRHDGWAVVEWNGERMLEVSWTLELEPGGKHTHTLASVYA